MNKIFTEKPKPNRFSLFYLADTHITYFDAKNCPKTYDLYNVYLFETRFFTFSYTNQAECANLFSE